MVWTLTQRMILCLFTSLRFSLAQSRTLERVLFARQWKGSHWLQKRGSKAFQSPSVYNHWVNFLTTCPAWTRLWVLFQSWLTLQLVHWWKTGWQTRREWRRTEEAGGATSVPWRSRLLLKRWASRSVVAQQQWPGTKPNSLRGGWGRRQKQNWLFLWQFIATVTATPRRAPAIHSKSWQALHNHLIFLKQST